MQPPPPRVIAPRPGAALPRSTGSQPEHVLVGPAPDTDSSTMRYENIKVKNVKVINAPPGVVGVNLPGQSATGISVDGFTMEGGDSAIRIPVDEAREIEIKNVEHRQRADGASPGRSFRRRRK